MVMGPVKVTVQLAVMTFPNSASASMASGNIEGAIQFPSRFQLSFVSTFQVAGNRGDPITQKQNNKLENFKMGSLFEFDRCSKCLCRLPKKVLISNRI